MGLRPLRCAHCGSTRIRYVRLGPGDEVALCEMCQRITESEEPSEAGAQEDLLLRLHTLRERGSEPEPVAAVRGRRPRSSSLSLILLVLGLVGLVLGMAYVRSTLLRGGVADAERLDPLPSARRVHRPSPEHSSQGEPLRRDEEIEAGDD